MSEPPPQVDLSDSFAIPTSASRGPSRRGLDQHSGESAMPPTLAPRLLAVEAKAKTERGRPRGSTKDNISLRRFMSDDSVFVSYVQPVQARSRSKIFTAAGTWRQARRRAKSVPKAGCASGSSLALAALPTPSVEVVVLWKAEAQSQTYLFNNAQAQALIAYRAASPAKKEITIKKEASILISALNTTSKKQLAKALGCSLQTVTRRLRQLAMCLLLVCKMRTEAMCAAMPTLLSAMSGGKSARKMLFIL